jgi:hypothetical protein
LQDAALRVLATFSTLMYCNTLSLRVLAPRR